jgi:hypothetical protein
VGLIGHAMFVRTPVDTPPARREPAQTAD